MILVDTDVMIDVLRRYPPAVVWLESLGEESVALPGFVVMELLQGCKNKTEQARLLKGVKLCRILWPSMEGCNEAITVFARCHRSHGIGMLDVLIAQVAIEAGVSLHTFNAKHYAPIVGLITIQPYARG
jgi:hypothetical protein